MLGIVLVIVVLAITYFILVKPVTYWKRKGVPQYTAYQIWKNNLTSFIKPLSIAQDFQNIYNSFSSFRYCGVYQFFSRALLIKDLELIKQITVKDFDHFTDHREFVPPNTEPLLENTLFALKGDKWKNMRITLSPSFTGSKMKMMFQLMKDCSNQFVEYFEEVVKDGEIVTQDVKDVFNRFANDVIASTAFGVNCNSLAEPNNEFFLMGKSITHLQGFITKIKFFIFMAAPAIGQLLRLRLFSAPPKFFFENTIKENIKTREENGIVRQDMIHLLMEARLNSLKSTDQNKEFTMKEMISQAFIFFFAGFDSVSALMCFLSHELAVNPEIQEQLQNEIDKTSEECDGNITYEVLSKMKYLDMVISEALRKWPPAFLLDRVCTKPYTIQPVTEEEKPVTLNKGDVLWIPAYALHRDPIYFSNPDRFDPDRFSEENKSKLTTNAYFPFGSGPRTCIANRFALLETKLLFFMLLQKFTLVVVGKTQIPLKLSNVTLQSNVEGGFWLGFKRRSVK